MSIDVYECQACGWVYPPQTDSVQQAEQPLAFSQLADDFQCPLCGVGKSQFQPVSSEVAAASAQSQAAAVNGEQSAEQRQDVVVIGAGLAGWTVIDALRAKDADIGITLITADQADRYHKPMLSVAFSQQKTAADLIRFTGEEASAKANITLMANTRVETINSQTQVITTDKGNIAYGNLVLATGATPVIPTCFDNEHIWHVNDIESFHKLQQALAESDKPQRIAVIGAGMVGTEIAEDLTKAGQHVTLIDRNDAPLAAMLPPVVTAKIKQALKAQGITFIGNTQVDSVTHLAEDGYLLNTAHCSSRHAASSDGSQEGDNSQHSDEQSLQVDYILMSTGLKVLPELANSAGVEFDPLTGIKVAEDTLQTSVAHIYAIGDCMSIGGVPCRYVAPFRAQAATITEHILGQQQPGYTHQAYHHKPPMIRLKNKSISVSATGTPRADESYGVWRVASDTQAETSQDMLLEQVAESGDVIATVTIKQPLA